MKLSGHEELRAARSILADEAGDRSDLLAAATHVWSAMFHRDEWPAELQDDADAIQPMLFKYGTISMTLDTMDEAELVELRQALTAFIEAAENAA